MSTSADVYFCHKGNPDKGVEVEVDAACTATDGQDIAAIHAAKKLRCETAQVIVRYRKTINKPVKA